MMEIVLPPLRRSRLVRPKGEQPAKDARSIRKLAKSYVTHLSIVVQEQKVRCLAGGLSAGVSHGHMGMGDGCYRAMPRRRD